MFNLVLFLDLYLTIKNPFEPKNARLKIQIATMVVLTIGFACFYFPLDLKLNDQREWELDIAILIIFILIFVVNLVVTCMIMRLLRVEGTSKELKTKVIKRHMSYFVFYTLLAVDSFLYYMYKTSQIGKNLDTHAKERFDWGVEIIDGALSLMGVVIAGIRLVEPYVWTNLKADLNYLGCRCCSNKRAKYS